MLLGLIKIAFGCTVAAIIVDVNVLDGIASHIIGTGLVAVAIALFNWGCRVSARHQRQSILDQSENALDIILSTSGDHPDIPI